MEGVFGAIAIRSTPTYCRICEVACGLVVDKDASHQPLRIRPDRQHPVSRGFVCAKGTRFLEVAGHPDRLLYPMQRQTDGSPQRVTWAEALESAARRLRPILERYGPHAVGLYFGNPLAFNTLGIMAMVGLMAALRTRNVFNAGSQDCNNKFAGAQLIHGSPLIHPIPDFDQTDFALLLGTNPAVSQASFVHLEGGTTVFDRLIERGGSVVWVDPRRTESALRWGDHLAIRPGTDIFLLLALLAELRQLYQPDSRVVGLAKLLDLAAQYPLPRAAGLTGLAPAQIRRLAADLRTANRATFHMSVGVNQGPFGTLSYVALQALAFLTGNLDRRGGLLFHPLAMPGAEVARRLQLGTETVYSRVGHFPSILNSLPGGVLADEILRPGPEQIRALIVVAGNPLKSIPGGAKLARALAELELLICVDLFMNDTGRTADLLLPTTSWLERWDLATTTILFQQAPLIQYAGPIQAAPGEARTEARVLADLCRAAGLPLFGNRLLSWLWDRLPSDAALHRMLDVTLWPVRPMLGGVRAVPSPRPRPGRYLGRGPRTPEHRLHFWRSELDEEARRLAAYASKLEDAEDIGSPAVVKDAGRGLKAMLICRRRRLGHNSWLHGAVREGRSESAAWLSPQDLEQLGLLPGDQIILQTRQHSLQLPAFSVAEVMPGTVVVPHGLPEANVNALIPSGVDMIEPLSGQHRLTGIPVLVTPVA